MTKRQTWKKEAERVSELVHDVWYRSPLWANDHLLGKPKHFSDEGLAFCGRPLLAAMEMTDDDLGGLFVTNRRTGQCSECRTRSKEYSEGNK